MKLFYTSPVLNVSRPNLRPALQTSMLKPQPSPAFQRVGMELSSQQIKELETKLPDIAEQFHDYGGQEDLLKGVVEGFIQFLKELPEEYHYIGFFEPDLEQVIHSPHLLIQNTLLKDKKSQMKLVPFNARAFLKSTQKDPFSLIKQSLDRGQRTKSTRAKFGSESS
jgi:hypothetical protein